MFSEKDTDGKNKHKKDTVNNLSYHHPSKKKTTIIDDIDNILSEEKIKYLENYKNRRAIFRIIKGMSPKKILSVILSFIFLFGVIASATSFVESDLIGRYIELSPSNDNSISSKGNVSDNNLTDNPMNNLIFPINQNETDINNESSINESLPLYNSVKENDTSNESIVNTKLNLYLQSDKNVYVVNETVSLTGNVSYNSSLVNTSINLLIIGPEFNWSQVLNTINGEFYFEFYPRNIGIYSAKCTAFFKNESAEASITIDVFDLPFNFSQDEFPDQGQDLPDISEKNDIPDNPFNMFFAPKNSLGASFVKVVNMDYFWEFFNRYSGWYLEAWDSVSGKWLNVTQYLNIIRNRSDDDQYEKISLEFIAPMTADYRLKYMIDRPVKEFSKLRDQYEYHLTFTVGENEEYTTFFNFSDIASLPGVIINHGVDEINGHDKFWFSVQENNIIVGTNVILDPIFGYIVEGFSRVDADDCPGGLFQMGSISGLANSISAYLKWANPGGSARCAIYDDSGVLLNNGITNEVTVTGTGWYTFPFSISPLLTADAWYYLVVFADTFKVELYYDGTGGNGLYDDVGETYPNFPDPYLANQLDADAIVSMYCSYSISPTVITNSSTGVEETNATLHGYLPDNGDADTYCYFLLNDTNDFGSPIINISKGIIADGSEFNNNTIGEITLNRGTMHYFKAQANNIVGWAEGGVEVFLTKPQTLIDFTASTQNDTIITLSWTNQDGGDGAYVEYALGSPPSPWNEGDGTPVDIDGNVTTPYSHSALTPNTRYYYKAWAYAVDDGWTSSGNATAPRSDDPQTTDAKTATVPTVITNASTGVEETNATLHGYLQYNGSVDTTCYFLLNDTNDFGSPIFNLSKSIIANNTEFSNDTTGEATLSKGALYYYKTQANNIIGWTDGSVEIFLTKPDPISSFTATATNSTQIDLTWIDGSGGDGAYIEYALGSPPSPWNEGDGTPVDADGNVTTPFSHTGLTPGVHYYYKAWAYAVDDGWTSSGNATAPRSDDPQTTDDWTNPGEPTNVATINGTTWINVTFSHGTNGEYTMVRRNASGSADYPVDRTSGILIDNTTNIYANDTSLSAGTIYYYSVWTWDSEGEKWCVNKINITGNNTNTYIEITPAQWDQGLLSMGSSNETIGFYFNLSNQGNVALNIQINATNATNTSTGAIWRLNATPSYDNFTLQYNKNGIGSWTTINLTYDTFVTNLAMGSWQTFDLKLLMPVNATYGHPLKVTVTFRSVAA